MDLAEGAHFTDVDGIEYTDLCLGDTGAMTGHAIPSVAEAIYDRAKKGITTLVFFLFFLKKNNKFICSFALLFFFLA